MAPARSKAPEPERHPDTILHLAVRGAVIYQRRAYGGHATLQVPARELDRVVGDYEIVKEVPPPA